MLELDGLTKSYGDRDALREVTFEVRPGEIFGFVGSNGAGKTTAMRIVLGVLAADAGEVRWQGRALDHDSRRRIGYMPEERGLYPRMRVSDQLVHLARLYGLTRSDATAAMVRWTETLGVAQRRDDEVVTLSLGNQQRVQLAAALLHDPAVLVLDEPFSGLDPLAVDVMSGVLRDRAAHGVPAVFSSHQLDLVERLCDRVGIIADGTMVAVGTIEELRRHERPRWIVDGRPAREWLDGVPGVREVRADGGRTVVEVSGATSEQALLAAALAAGPVREFAPDRPSLVDLYRGVVTGAEEAA